MEYPKRTDVYSLNMTTFLKYVNAYSLQTIYRIYLTVQKRLTADQSGNNKKLHSTETLNMCITDIILSSMDKGKLTALVLLELPKALDSIIHPILLKKLQIHGVSAEATLWFKSYL